jgi:diguanylate cyclase (GGDEF)-like protein
MSEASKNPPKRTPLFRVRFGHVLLAVSTAAMIMSLIIWSFISMQVHESDKNQIFAQESDSAALTFVQRESFNVMLKIEQWAAGQRTARDVQISRAMLGQRLGVETESGLRTFETVGGSYRQALAAIDPVIRELANVPVAERAVLRRNWTPVLETFSEQTRALSETFQNITREKIQLTTTERANAELIQAIILTLILVFSGALSTWITFDIVRGFKRASRLISDRQKKVDASLARLLLVQSMDERSRELIQAVHEGLGSQEALHSLKKIVTDLLPGSVLEIELSGFEVDKFEMTIPQELNISQRDYEFMRDRALEVLSNSLLHDQQKQDMRYALQHDNLTGLANRSAFTAVVQEKAKTVNQRGGVLGLVYVDIDRFGDLNSSMGYQAGDLVLINTGFRISDVATSNEFAARLSSDEFAVVGVYKNENEARARALAIQKQLTFDMPLEQGTASITVSMGCAISAAGHVDDQEIPRWAALAIHLAKKQDRRSSFVTYNTDDHAHLMASWQEEIAVRNALATGEFKMFFQPIVSLESRNPDGFEALIRWDRPGVGIVTPDNFLPLVNSAGLATAVGADVIVQSLRGWHEVLQPACAAMGIEDPYISINLDAAQLQDPGFVNFVMGEIAHANVPKHCVQLEVTEHALIGGQEVMNRLVALREAGIKIALDDFGTGYSNLSQTMQLPLDVLKLDKSLLHGIEDEDKALRMIEDITKMAQGQDLVVTAEGIETERIAGLLQRMKVDRGQGYLFGRAMPAQEIQAWVASLKL